MPACSVAIVGGGFSGTTLAIALADTAPPGLSIRLIEQTATAGPGLAYGTQGDVELLNVPASRMSAFADRPSDFLDWLRARSASSPDRAVPEAGCFASRRLYGIYLQDLLAEALRRAPPNRLAVVRGQAVALSRTPHGMAVSLADGRRMEASVAVLATGGTPPAPPAIPGCSALDPTSYRENPWARDTIDDLPPEAAVLTIGSGLTMIDTVCRLLDRGHTGPISVLSRRGLVSLAHVPSGLAAALPVPPDLPRTPLGLTRYLRGEAARLAAAGETWHGAIDGLRPVAQAIWRGWNEAERSGFLRHLRPFWDIHRHRMPAAVAARVRAARESGQIQVLAGRLVRFDPVEGAVRATWRRRGGDAEETFLVHRVVNCTGPTTDVRLFPDPLTRALLEDGLARSDRFGLGFDTTAEDRVVDRTGIGSDRLFAIGPICRPEAWEIVAVPDIRVRSVALSRRIADTLASRDRAAPFGTVTE